MKCDDTQGPVAKTAIITQNVNHKSDKSTQQSGSIIEKKTEVYCNVVDMPCSLIALSV